MKKIIIILTIFLFYNVPAHSDKLLKNGFLNNNMNYAKEQNIINPKDKIILIYNHGQDDHDKPSKKTCVWKNGIRNFSSLVGKKVDGKEIMLYLLCTDHLAGDDWKRLWTGKKLNPPYKGKPKLEKRLEELSRLTNEIGATPIFVTQKTLRWKKDKSSIYSIDKIDHYFNEKNISKTIIDFCIKNNIKYIDGFNKLRFIKEDTWDLVHTSPAGSKKIADLIYLETKSIFHKF